MAHAIAATTPTPATTLPPCPDWCVGDCIGGESDRLHERTIAKLVADDAQFTADKATLRVYVERLDSIEGGAVTSQTRVVVDVARHPLPDVAAVDVAAVTADYSNAVCRAMFARELAGVDDWKKVTLTAAQLRIVAGALAYGAELLAEAVA